eukprot:PhF_6_TR5549/c0_g1_i1/m.7915
MSAENEAAEESTTAKAEESNNNNNVGKVLSSIEIAILNERYKKKIQELVEQTEPITRSKLENTECSAFEQLAETFLRDLMASKLRSQESYYLLHKMAMENMEKECQAREEAIATERKYVQSVLHNQQHDAMTSSPSPVPPSSAHRSSQNKSRAIEEAIQRKQKVEVEARRRLEQIKQVQEEAYQKEWLKQYRVDRMKELDAIIREESRVISARRMEAAQERVLENVVAKDNEILDLHKFREARRQTNALVRQEIIKEKKEKALAADLKRQQKFVARETREALSEAERRAVLDARNRVWKERSTRKDVVLASQQAKVSYESQRAALIRSRRNEVLHIHEQDVAAVRTKIEAEGYDAADLMRKCADEEFRKWQHNVHEHTVRMEMMKEVTDIVSQRHAQSAMEKLMHDNELCEKATVEEIKRIRASSARRRSASNNATAQTPQPKTPRPIPESFYQRLQGDSPWMTPRTVATNAKDAHMLVHLRHISPAQFSQLQSSAQGTMFLKSMEHSRNSPIVMNKGPPKVFWR